ncbi:MAG: hypothetical protein Q9179_000319 [Wetmoreana sp. 5 TL-2023]
MSQGLARMILGIQNDLYSFLMGYGVSDDGSDGDRERLFQGRERASARDVRGTLGDTKLGRHLLQDLIDETMNSKRRSDLLESQIPFIKGPIGPMLRDQDTTTHRYEANEFDCMKFHQDVLAFSESFKCYRQCDPSGYYGSASYAIQRLQIAYERHYSGSFYAQIREIEAETNCYFDDAFLIDTERAVDYTKVWIQTFQRHERPCAGIGKG